MRLAQPQVMMIGGVPSSAVSDLHPALRRVGADNVVTSRDLRILVDQAAQRIASSDAYVAAGGCDVGSAVGWSLAEGPVRPVGAVVIGVFAEGVVEMPSAGDEDPVCALAPGTG